MSAATLIIDSVKASYTIAVLAVLGIFAFISATLIAWPALAVTALFWVYASTWMWHVLRAEVYFKESRVMKDLQLQGLIEETDGKVILRERIHSI